MSDIPLDVSSIPSKVATMNDVAISAAENDELENHSVEQLTAAGIVFLDSQDFMANEPPQMDWIVTDVIAKGMKGDLNAKSKQMKSFFGFQCAECVATGRPFLNMQVPKARRTAYFNLELLDRGVWEREHAMEEAFGIKPERGMFYIVNLRGKAVELRNHTPELVVTVKKMGIDFVILDPRYKLICEGEDENKASGLQGVLDFRDALADVAAVLMIGHDPKGDTSGKSMADRGAGSYIGGADYDFSFALSPHEQDGASVLSTSCRYRGTPPNLTIRFDAKRQIFEADAETPATVKQARRGYGSMTADPKKKAERERLKLDALEKAVRDFANSHELMSMGTFRQSIKATPEGAAFAQNPLRVAIDALIEKGIIAKTPEKMRTDGGEVKQSKVRTVLVGAPEKVKHYNDSFCKLTL